MPTKRTEINEIGEFGLIERIKNKFVLRDTDTVFGIGDDAAVINSGDYYTLLSSDMIIEGIDFDLAYFPLQHLGYKSVALNVSDIAAMNGRPRQILVNLALSNRFSVEAVDSFYEGISRACENYRVDLAGGDISSSAGGLMVSIAILGTVEKDRITRRCTAGENDIICVSGDLGASFIGLKVLQREKEVFLADSGTQPELDKYEHVVHKHLKPEARMDIVHELRELGIVPTSMIDVSDGLASDLMHICHQSSRGAVIFEDKLPVDPLTYRTTLEFKIDPSVAVLNGGEDFELLFTIKQGDFEKLKNHQDIHMIGYIRAKKEGIIMIDKKDTRIPLTAQGWNHFRK